MRENADQEIIRHEVRLQIEPGSCHDCSGSPDDWDSQVLSWEEMMHRAHGHSCNRSRLRSKQPVEQGGLVDGMQRTSQRSRVLDSESNIGRTSLQRSGPIRAQRMKTTTYQPTKTSWIPSGNHNSAQSKTRIRQVQSHQPKQAVG